MTWQELLDTMRDIYPECPLCGGEVGWASIGPLVFYDESFRVHTIAGTAFTRTDSDPAWRGKCQSCEWWVEMGSRGDVSGL